jgi:signal transduction histidine kinase
MIYRGLPCSTVRTVTSSNASNAATADGPSPRWPRPSEWPVWAVPLVVGFIQVVGSTGANYRATQFHGGDPEVANSLDPFAYLLLLAGPIALLGRRRHPVPVVVAIQVITLCYNLRGYTIGPVFLSLVVAYAAAVTAGHRIAAWATAAGGFAASFGLTVLLHALDVGTLPSRPQSLASAASELGWTLVVLIAAELVRLSSERTAEARRTRAEEQRRQASEERLRIARELHDVLAHNISMINVQAGVALHLMDEQPEQARTALAAIKEASKEAITEMRSVIGILRQRDEAAPRAPTPGLDSLDDLVSRARTAGLRVTLSLEGTRRPLPGGVDLAAFRIVQEALTNVTRHARPTAGDGLDHRAVTASIRVVYGPHDVVVQVDDNGRAGAVVNEQSGGSGIPGMRERAGTLGGEFTAGPRDGGGFRVRARLPIEEST